MANWQILKAAIADVIKTNGNQEITGQVLQNVLNNIVSSVGENSTFAGIATPATNPGVPDGNVFYLATEAGIYANFNGIEIASGEAVILEWKGSWVKKASGLATQKKLAELEANNNNLTLLDGYSSTDVKVIENFQYVRIKKDIDISDLRVATVYNDASIPKRILIKYSNGNVWKSMDMTSNYYSDDDIELYYNWDKHIDNINYATGLIGILESSKNISISNSLLDLYDNIKKVKEIIKNTTSFVYSENNTENELKILSCFKQIKILGSYQDLCINTIYNAGDIPKRMIIRAFDNSIEQLIDFSDNHYEGDTKLGYVIIDFDWNYFIANCTNINDNAHKYIIIKSDAFIDKLYDNIKKVKEIIKNTTSFVYSENNTENELKILSCFKQIKILGSYQDLCINTIYNAGDIPKRMIIRAFDNSIEQLIDFSDNHYEGDTKLGYVIIDFDWNYFIANCTNINDNAHKYIIIKSDAFIDKLYDNVKEVKDNIITPETEEIQYDEIIQAYPNFTTGAFVNDTQAYAKTAIFSLQKDAEYVIIGNTKGPTDVSYCSIMFTTDRESMKGTSLLNTDPKNIGADVNLKFKPTSDGYLFVWLFFSSTVPYTVGKKIGDLYLPKENEKNIKELKNLINAISEEIRDKNLAIMGDSIMMLMRTNSVPSNTVTYQDTEGITYDYSLLTNKNGHLYVTSTLQDGNVIETSKMVDIVNSSQAAFDAQNWEALKQKLEVKNLYNFGLGGAVFAERQVVTSYPYPDGNGWTTDLPNEVRWLIRRYTEGYIEYPDCIVIWLGTNGAGEPSSDNYNEIMALTYDELNSDEHYADRKTLYGGLRWSLETLYRTFQYATIILVTPVQTNLEDYSRTYDKLTTTANAIKKMAGRYSCMVFDALNEIGVVDFFEKSDGSGYFLYDGLHPNSKGTILWKNYLAQKLKSLFFAKRDL